MKNLTEQQDMGLLFAVSPSFQTHEGMKL